VWVKDDTLTLIVGYHMDCVKPVGATRLVSENVGRYRFCPYCGRPVRFSDRITVGAGN
jgi:hypothetical protein